MQLATETTLRTRSGQARMLPLANIASKVARIATAPTTRGPPGWMQTMSSSSAQQAMSFSMSAFCRAS